MSRKVDLEENIRESYALIGQYETIQRDTDRPEERKRAKRIIDEQWDLVKDYLHEYQILCQQLRLAIPDDIAQVVARFDYEALPDTDLIRSSGEGNTGNRRTRLLEGAEQSVRTSHTFDESKHHVSRRTIIIAVIISAILSLIVGLLSNLAATFIAPSFQARPWIVYGALIVTFIIALPITIYLFMQSFPDEADRKEESTMHYAGAIEPSPEMDKPPSSASPTKSIKQLPGKFYRELVGRDIYMGDIMAALRDPSGKWIVAVDGMGGIGKTALAREVAERCLAERLFDVVVWEQAPKVHALARDRRRRDAGTLTYESALDSIARQLGVLDVPRLKGAEKEARVRVLLRVQRVLVVLDNLETSKEPQNEIARKLRLLLDPSKALLTSRHRFQGDLYAINLTGLDEGGALRFVRQEAEEKGIRRVAVAKSDELKQIAEATGGSPLALKLVIGQLGHLPLETVLEQLSGVRMMERESDEDDYYRFYKHIFFPSWQLLSGNAKKLLISMAHFAPGVGGTLEAVKTTSDLADNGLTRSIDELWRLSFLEIGESSSLKQVRYYLHALTQYFVLSDIVQVLK